MYSLLGGKAAKIKNYFHNKLNLFLATHNVNINMKIDKFEKYQAGKKV